jgi:hypothetical protein
MLACGGNGIATTPSPPRAIAIDPVECPTANESADGKIFHQSYLREHTDQTQNVTITLRPIQWTNPACEASSEECADRDQALQERQALNAKQLECVLAAFGPRDAVGAIRAEWYEPLETPSTGRPTPIGIAFSVLTVWSQLEAVARHPYVQRIDPAPGESAKLGIASPPSSTECPAAMDPPEPKLVDAVSVQRQGRKPVVIELTEASLPTLRMCPGDELCDDEISSGWALTVASTRQMTCVRRFIDTKLTAAAPGVAYGSARGFPQGPALPPFGESIHSTMAFALGLTWEEAVEAAKHPGIQRIWTSEGLSLGELPEGCPPDYDAPVASPECSSASDPTTNKFTAEAAAEWQAASGPNEVIVGVRDDQPVCPAPACPGRAVDCPELDRYVSWTTKVAIASQSCVRELIVAIGGSASAEVHTGSIAALLTWSQIQELVTHPEVVRIEPRFGGTLP